MVATESALKGRACKPLADGSVLLSGRGAQALQVFAVAFMRLHDSGALCDEGGKAVLFGRLRGVASPNILPLMICESRYVQIPKCIKRKSFYYFDYVYGNSVGSFL